MYWALWESLNIIPYTLTLSPRGRLASPEEMRHRDLRDWEVQAVPACIQVLEEIPPWGSFKGSDKALGFASISGLGLGLLTGRGGFNRGWKYPGEGCP